LVPREAAAIDVWPPEKLNVAAPVEDEWLERSITQRVQYRREPTGISVDGWLRLSFTTGQRVAVAHVAFSPAFDNAPQADAEVLHGPNCEIRPTLVLPWGIRWEVRLESEAIESTEVVLGFAAFENP
jgi:hypothetical protein